MTNLPAGSDVSGVVDNEPPAAVRGAIRIAKPVAVAYGYVMGILLVAFVAAQLGGLIDLALHSSDMLDRLPVPIRHILWCVGALVAAVGLPLNRLRVSDGSPPNPPSPVEQPAGNSPKNVRRSGVLSSAGFFALIGGVLGFALGGSLALAWFSLALSPWPPEGWLESFVTHDLHSHPDPFHRHQPDGIGVTSSHPLLLTLLLGPAVLLAGLGALGGGIAAALGYVTEPVEEDASLTTAGGA